MITVANVNALVFQYNSINPFHWHPLVTATDQYSVWPPSGTDVNVTYPDGDGSTDLLCDTDEDCPTGILCVPSPSPPRCSSVNPAPSASPSSPAPIPSPTPNPPSVNCNLNGTWEQPHPAAAVSTHFLRHSGDAFVTILPAPASVPTVTGTSQYTFSCVSKNSLCPGNKALLNGTLVLSTTSSSVTLVPTDGSKNILGYINSTLNCNTITLTQPYTPVVWNNINPLPPQPLNLNVTAASFLGTTEYPGFVISGIAVLGTVSPSSTTTLIAVAGNGQVTYPGITPVMILNGTATSNGTIIILSTDVTKGTGSGVTVVNMLKMGDRIDHLRSNTAGSTAIAGSFGVAVIEGLLTTPLKPVTVWKDDLTDIYPNTCGVCCGINGGNGYCRIDIGNDGVVAIDLAVSVPMENGSNGDLWAVYTNDGERFIQQSRSAASLDTVAVNSQLNQVMVGYFYNSNTGKEPMVMPRLEVYRYSAPSSKPTLPTVTLDYVDFPWNAEVYRQPGPCNGDVADGRIMGARIGDDGSLLFMGRSDGGDSPFQCGIRNSSRITPLVTIDGFTSTYNMQAQAVTNIMKVDSGTGEIIVGQLQVTRLANTRGNTLVTYAAQSDTNGNVYLLQSAACCIANMGNLTINGNIPLSGPGDATVLHILSPTFEQRYHWTHFVKNNGTMGSGNPVDIDIKKNTVAVALTSNGDLVTSGNVPNTVGNTGGDPVGYIVILPIVGSV